MTTEVKCIYEDGWLKPMENIELEEQQVVFVKIEDTAMSTLQKELKEGYQEMVKVSQQVTEDWKYTEKELE